MGVKHCDCYPFIDYPLVLLRIALLYPPHGQSTCIWQSQNQYYVDKKQKLTGVVVIF